jgi:molybdenum cofactor cytidylyltransferase
VKFGSVNVGDAQGTVLAHKLALANRVLKKGHLLTRDDIADLKAQNIDDVIVAQLDDSDVGEDEAAKLIADELSSPSIEQKQAFTGRVNFYATNAGIFHADVDAINSLNRISPDITLATLNNGVFVEAGRMVATVKIIPFAVPQSVLNTVLAHTKANGSFSLTPSVPFRAGLIGTKLPSLKSSTMDKTREILINRLEIAGSALNEEMRVAHEVRELSAALRVMVNRVDIIIVFGASAITDRQDVIPAALEAAGGQVVRFGMPVDPGNLLMMGELEGKPVIGAPGCARSPAENGFDWVLQRLLAQLPVDDDFISGLGVGGLLMEITSRPQPREG